MKRILLVFSVLFIVLDLSVKSAFAQSLNTINKADTSWMMVSTALVMLMTFPGLILFYSGLVKKLSALNTMLMSIVSYAIVSVIWFVFGFPLVFGKDFFGIIGSFTDVFFSHITSVSGSIPTILFAVYQMTFAAITVSLISGALVERIKFKSWIIFTVLWVTFVYIPLAHWVWGDGWLAKLGVLDFAGGIVVHISAGISALAMCLILGRRKDMRILPHQLGYSVIGAGLLWFGWFGFNAGSALSSGQLAVDAFINTNIAASSGLLTWMAIDLIKDNKATVLGAISGCIAGLGAITPDAGYVNISSALVIGIISSCLCYFAITFIKPKFNYDDTLDVFGIHGISGIWGSLALGIFANPLINGAKGLLFGSATQIVSQIIGVVVAIIYCFTITFLIGLLIQRFFGLRVSRESEIKGLDESEHEESAYEF
ncbi:ammonium transporter [Thermodesulfobium narugense DSM 14796]|uniref:Ammonium transporter n=1 Tax=Thermodesulfobium narugense DSM 14796 TaxID=747365 RepID=M1E9H5_9BACT|nr:ammonium transporter [Thermodesulfobium narugense]AEE15289.1 ammonium transporter [Thermodesulfobium narugense DSM 14796]